MPVRRFYSPRRVLTLTAIIVVILAAAYYTGQAWARAPKPIAAPQSLLRARHACPNTASLVACRSALRKAYAAIAWQRRARNKTASGTSRDVVLDAIVWASEKYHVAAWQMRSVAECESHLFFRAHNGQYLGAWQLGAMHRSDSIFDRVPWQDPYAQASHVARFVKAHSWSQWQCQPGGGLRW